MKELKTTLDFARWYVKKGFVSYERNEKEKYLVKIEPNFCGVCKRKIQEHKYGQSST